MNKILIHKSNENTCITHFTMNASDSAIRQEADKILEFGQCFRIADISELPEDRVFRDAWEIDDSDLNDGIAGEFTAESNLSILTKSKSLQEEELQRLSGLPEKIKQKEEEFKTKDESIKADWVEISALEEELSKLNAQLEELSIVEETAETSEETEVSEETKQSIRDLNAKIGEQKSLIVSKISDADEKRAAADKVEQEIADYKNDIENLPSIISGLESSVEKISEDILDTEAKINQLLEILPLDQRRSSND